MGITGGPGQVPSTGLGLRHQNNRAQALLQLEVLALTATAL